MKSKELIYFCLSLLFFLSSCTQEGEIELTDVPITFSTGVEISTRGESLNNLFGKSFGVRGYIYEKGWDSEEALAKPDPQWLDTKVTCANTGECAYQNIQRWQNKKNYAFFAYYPYTGDTAPGEVKLSPSTDLKSPVLIYKMSKAAYTDRTKMYDVMYAYKIDANITDNPTVNFHFRHCLTAIQVIVENLNENPVSISNLSLSMQLKHDFIRIPLNGDPVVKNGVLYNPDSYNATYTFINNKKVAIPSTLNKPYIDISNGNHILFIPQKGTKIKLEYTANNEAPKTLVHDFSGETFTEGQRYLVSLQFVGKEANVLLIKADNWLDSNTDIEFE